MLSPPNKLHFYKGQGEQKTRKSSYNLPTFGGTEPKMPIFAEEQIHPAYGHVGSAQGPY